MAQTSMTVRIDSQQKAMFDSLCEQFGMSANAAINVFVKAVIRTRSIGKGKQRRQGYSRSNRSFWKHVQGGKRKQHRNVSWWNQCRDKRSQTIKKRTQWFTQLLIPTYLYQLLSQKIPQPQHAELSYAMKNLFIILDAKLIKIFVKTKETFLFKVIFWISIYLFYYIDT